ncbi:cryptochrome/photolyase family protein [Marinicella sp. W31]|uniref:cryptochrome/photolyase family protein n=1 Tax=Marinicella sp. W31 TaxID=3023713 RepID=UPI003757B2B9
MTNIVWFRRDLRLADNPALTAAINSGRPVVALFIDYTQQHQLHDEAPIKIDFMRANINSLVKRLTQLNIPSLVKRVKTFNDVPDLMKKLIQQHDISSIHLNKEYLLDEHNRDTSVANLCHQHAIDIHMYDANYLLAPGSVIKDDGSLYQVFTPYKKRYIQRLNQDFPTPLPFPKPVEKKTEISAASTLEHNYCSDQWPASEKQAHQILKAFLNDNDYAQERDYPDKPGTSSLSPYLACGILSARQCFAQATRYDGEAIHSTWVSELIWREFYRDLIFHRPELCKHKPFKTDAADHWQNDPSLIAAWQNGKTGFPIVDAGMRQLNTTGWMHNRVRMITASFLTKLCLVDWRIGEKYFMQKLIDGDFASNNGGWQWSSASGADAAPYFRIFNPTTQSQKFDAQGDYIKTYVPELAELNSKDIHNPKIDQRNHCGYAHAVIDYPSSRKKSLEWFKANR